MAPRDKTYGYLGIDNPRKINWFPGHMAKAIKEVQKKLKLVDLVLEIRDARVPLLSTNNKLLGIMEGKKRLIVLNKANLADPDNLKAFQRHFRETGETALFVNALDHKTLKELIPKAKAQMKEKWAKFERKGFRPPPLRMMVAGLPNTGKSTLINRLSKRKATTTGDRPGVTRTQEWISLAKEVELLDTPGIMPPRIDTEYQGLCLSAIHAIRDEILGPEHVARFVLELFLEQAPQKLRQRYQIEATEEMEYEEAIQAIAMRLKNLKQEGQADLTKTSIQVLKDFREGRIGSLIFEEPPKEEIIAEEIIARMTADDEDDDDEENEE